MGGLDADLSLEAFVERFGGAVECSPWVALEAFAAGPFESLDALTEAFTRALRRAPRERQLAVLLAHPDLAVRERAGQRLTAESAAEQAGAGLDTLRDADRIALAERLDDYRRRFGFPFIACVRDHGGVGLLELVEERMTAEPEAEFEVALAEVGAIAGHRLRDIVVAGRPDCP